jgi:hypothetical protein
MAGWGLAGPPEEITLLAVHDAVGLQSPFGLHHTEPNASWASPIEAQSGPVRAFVMGGSDHRNHPALARKLEACLRWRNAHARHPGVLAAQCRERARLRSERQQRWGRPKPKAA